MKVIDHDAIRYAFVGYGWRAGAPDEERGRLYLDVGNDLRPGVIDHHHLAAYAGSTARLVLAHPELVLQAVEPGTSPARPLTIVLHTYPDLDCMVSAYLVRSLLTRGAYPEGADALAGYSDRVDAGYRGISRGNPFSLYAACQYLAHRLLLRNWSHQDQMWKHLMDEALQAVDFVAGRAAVGQQSVLEIDAFECPRLFGPRDRDEINEDLARYHRKLVDPRTCAQRVSLRLPTLYGGTEQVSTLLVRDVQNAEDPERVMFFKDWARTDPEFSPDARGFVGLCVYHCPAADRKASAILSVTPESGACLRGLGAMLEQEESRRRIQRHGVDDREIAPATSRKQPGRWPGSHSDPWYDGRGHNFTIVAAPREGTVLTADEVERIFLQYGRRDGADIGPLPLPSPGAVAATEEEADRIKRHWSYLGESRSGGGVVPAAQAPDVFISYPRSWQAWVEQRLYHPLQDWLGPQRIFFDRTTLTPGTAWIRQLAAGIQRCRIFLPVYCADYFQRPFCEWELQLALTRDPVGEKRIIIPLAIELVEPPFFCRNIQAVDGTAGDPWPALQPVLKQLLQP
jgi:hypothetical protein